MSGPHQRDIVRAHLGTGARSLLAMAAIVATFCGPAAANHEQGGLALGSGASGSINVAPLDLGDQLAETSLAGATVSFGLVPGPNRPFTPELTLSPATSQAAAHPDLTFEMRKQRNHCPDWEDDPNVNPDRDECLPHKVYIEQDLKKMAVRLPPGLLGDVNAAPYCDARQEWLPSGGKETEQLLWVCANPDALVGEVDITVAGCDPYRREFYDEERDLQWVNCGTNAAYDEPGVLLTAKGNVYNERPGAGEQGHLIVLWPGDPATPGEFGGQLTRADVSLRVTEDMAIESIADNIPDSIQQTLRKSGGEPYLGYQSGAQISDLVMTLYGSTGIESGHALIQNPTFCDPQQVEVEFQGYEYNSIDNRQVGDQLVPPSGEGKVRYDSAPYQATGCDQVPYDPKLAIAFDTTASESVPAITSTVSQGLGEATNKRVKVSFPSSYKINAQNKAEHCPESDLAAKTCPEAARVGRVTAESPLLPIGQRLEGGVYLAGLTDSSVKFSAFLEGFVSLRIDGEGKIEGDGTLTTTFSDLPPVPISRFDLALDGGADKGLLKNPRVCAPQTIAAEFESHSGKVARPAQDLTIAGCTDPALDAHLSTRAPGERTDVELTLGSKGTRIASVDLRLPRQLRWGVHRKLGVKKSKQLAGAGEIAFETTAGQTKTSLKASRTRRGNVRLKELPTKTADGQVAAQALPDFGASLFRSSTTAKKRAARRSKRRRARTGRSSLTLAGIPQNDLTEVSLVLRGRGKRRPFYLRNPRRCGKRLNFVAYVTTVDGRKLAIKDSVKLKRHGCD